MFKKVLVISLSLILLLSVGMATAQEPSTLAVGEPLLLQGKVTDTAGTPIVGAAVEIWQTDGNGNYNHPADSDPSQLVDFQYFGTATTDADGNYAFLTIKPAPYEPRPTHIHVKVKVDGAEVLTTQFYFLEDFSAVEQDQVFQAGNAEQTLFLQTVDTTDEAGNMLHISTGNLILNFGEAGTLMPTAVQTEGPYYPVVDFSSYDNNLVSTAPDDVVVNPILETAPVAFTLLNLNTASSEDFLTIPDMGNRMVREFEEYRPYISIQEFRREIGKYVDESQVAAYEAYVYVPVSVDESDAETLMQIPGVSEDIANALMAARPFGSNEAFLTALAQHLSADQVSFAANYLAVE
jgi:DNA uptake protein ComE-like DNA-binding protein